MALVMVLGISVLLIILIFAALTFGSQNLVFMSGYNDRIQALNAAQAGVQMAFYEINNGGDILNKTEQLNDNSCFSYNIIMNQDRTAGSIYSEGWTGNLSYKKVRKKIQADISEVKGGSNVIIGEDQIKLNGSVYINGIESRDNPKYLSGSICTSYTGATAYSSDQMPGSVNITGLATCRNHAPKNYNVFNGGLSKLVYSDNDYNLNQNISDILTYTINQLPADDRTIMPFPITNNNFNGGQMPFRNFTVDKHMKITGDGNLYVDGDLTFTKKGAILYVEKNLLMNGQIKGEEGTIIVERDALIRCSVNPDSNNIKLYVAGKVKLVHTTFDGTAHMRVNGYNAYMTIDDISIKSSGSSSVSNYFQQMPFGSINSINIDFLAKYGNDSNIKRITLKSDYINQLYNNRNNLKLKQSVSDWLNNENKKSEIKNGLNFYFFKKGLQ